MVITHIMFGCASGDKYAARRLYETANSWSPNSRQNILHYWSASYNKRNVCFRGRRMTRKRGSVHQSWMIETWVMLLNTLQNTLLFWVFGGSAMRNLCILAIQNEWSIYLVSNCRSRSMHSQIVGHRLQHPFQSSIRYWHKLTPTWPFKQSSNSSSNSKLIFYRAVDIFFLRYKNQYICFYRKIIAVYSELHDTLQKYTLWSEYIIFEG